MNDGNFEPKKLALIRIWQILKERSDDEHPLTYDDICTILLNDYGINIERKAVGRNLSLLREAGIEIESTRDGSYLSSRDFEDSELRVLIDCVLGCKHITAKYSRDLIERICGLSSKYFKSNVKNIYSVGDWNKTHNRDLFYNIDIVDEAIKTGRQVHYDYNKYGIDKKLHKTSQQYVSPYQMILHNQQYYLMAYSEYWKNMVFHRMDHITNMEIIDAKATKITDIEGYENGINYRDISTAMPYMYTDKPERIDFIADISIIDQIIDWFGTEINIKQDKNNEKKIHISVRVSPNAMEFWALQYLKHVEITTPEKMRSRIKDALGAGVEKYM